MKNHFLLAINTGSTSTKVAVYEGEELLFRESIQHRLSDFKDFSQIIDQYPLRISVINELLKHHNFDTKKLDAVVGRGGILKPISGGVWKVGDVMLKDLRDTKTSQHASNLSGIIAHEIAEPLGIPAYIVDPVVVDEMDPVAKVTGLPEISRRSIFHALNQKATARRAAAELGKPYEKTNLIVAHMGGGITVGAHKEGRVVDVNNGLNGDGPFSPERSGSIPVTDLISLCFSGKYSEEDLQKMVRQGGGLKAYFGTTDTQAVMKQAEAGDQRCSLILEAMAYQVSKEIAGLGAVFGGEIDGIILTGGLAQSDEFIGKIRDRIGYMGRIFLYPGENELEALRDNALRVLRGEAQAHEYE